MSRKKKVNKLGLKWTLPPKWTLPALGFGLFMLVIYEFTQQVCYPIVVQEGAPIRIQVCFTPTHRCQKRIISAINRAEDNILVMCYSFTAKQIAQALVDARRRGVKVEILSDKSQRENAHTQVSTLHHTHGIPVYIDYGVSIAHNKVVIIDDKLVITGSYNYSEAAENRNAENLVFIESRKIAQQYKRNWLTRRSDARPLS